MTPYSKLLNKALKLLEVHAPASDAFDREWEHFSKRPGRPLTEEDKALANRFWTLGQISMDSSYDTESREYFRDTKPEQLRR